MIEPEMAFYDIADNMDLAEDFVKHCITWALENCIDDIQFLSDMYDKELIERLKFVINNDFCSPKLHRWHNDSRRSCEKWQKI